MWFQRPPRSGPHFQPPETPALTTASLPANWRESHHRIRLQDSEKGCPLFRRLIGQGPKSSSLDFQRKSAGVRLVETPFGRIQTTFGLASANSNKHGHAPPLHQVQSNKPRIPKLRQAGSQKQPVGKVHAPATGRRFEAAPPAPGSGP